MTVLVIDPDSSSLDPSAEWLREDGYQVIVARDGLSSVDEFLSHHPDAVFVDLTLSDPVGWEIVQSIRGVSIIPVFVVSTAADQVSLRKAFDLGVDGYVVKPSKRSELLERLTAARHRMNGSDGHDGTTYDRGGPIIDWRRREVRVDGKLVHLTATEFRLLSLLAKRRGRVLTHDEILSDVWGPNHVGDRNSVKLYVWCIRQKVEAEPANPRWIVTKRGVGYCLAAASDA